ncbi:hypothetical protein HMPREF9370_2117 [Neisseria wadsworthii 9715]|uniref:Secreted protein n=2 Tax=Neisseria TaxID=482 RepID=G4CSN5_9NEIS|nr:hypothetical protein HMPREF9370_2117 [Neisseria wadsworthii 9715]
MTARFFNFPISLLLKMALHVRAMAAVRNAIGIRSFGCVMFIRMRISPLGGFDSLQCFDKAYTQCDFRAVVLNLLWADI